MTMSVSGNRSRNMPMAALWVTLGLVLLAGAWLIPVNLKSVTPPLLREAGRATPSVAAFGEQLIDAEKLGPAQLVLAAARIVDDKGAAALDRSIRDMAARRPEWVVWGGWDPFLDPLIKQNEALGRTESTPVLNFFIAEKARRSRQESGWANARCGHPAHSVALPVGEYFRAVAAGTARAV